MIRKTGSGWTLFSKDGKKRLGGPYKTREEAIKREMQVNFWKHKKGK